MANVSDAPRRDAWRERLAEIIDPPRYDATIDAILDAEDAIRSERRWTDADVKALLTAGATIGARGSRATYFGIRADEADAIIAAWPLP